MHAWRDPSQRSLFLVKSRRCMNVTGPVLIKGKTHIFNNEHHIGGCNGGGCGSLRLINSLWLNHMIASDSPLASKVFAPLVKMNQKHEAHYWNLTDPKPSSVQGSESTRFFVRCAEISNFEFQVIESYICRVGV